MKNRDSITFDENPEGINQYTGAGSPKNSAAILAKGVASLNAAKAASSHSMEAGKHADRAEAIAKYSHSPAGKAASKATAKAMMATQRKDPLAANLHQAAAQAHEKAATAERFGSVKIAHEHAAESHRDAAIAHGIEKSGR